MQSYNIFITGRFNGKEDYYILWVLIEHFPLHFQNLYPSLSISQHKFHLDSSLIFRCLHKEVHAVFLLTVMKQLPWFSSLKACNPESSWMSPLQDHSQPGSAECCASCSSYPIKYQGSVMVCRQGLGSLWSSQKHPHSTSFP